MKRVLYFDCLSGISGDMTIGALLDLGVDQSLFQERLSSLALGGYRLDIKKKLFNGISGSDFNVTLTDEQRDHKPRNLYDIEHIIDSSGLNDYTKDLSKRIFSCIAQAESVVHDKPVEKIHFHEVGAVDSIIDIVGTAICLSVLEVDGVYASPLPLGTGFVKSAHSVIPIPAPATVEILKGVPVYSTGIEGELTTPTGAAIIKTIAKKFIPVPSMTIEKIGYGIGKKELEIPNALRVFLGDAEIDDGFDAQRLVMLETNIDDMNPETYSYLAPKLLMEGALDVYLANVIMKKGRPGVVLHVLCQPSQCAKFEDLLFRETTTFGIRKQTIERRCLERKFFTLDTRFGQIQVKAAYKEGKLVKVAPEYEECRRIAEAHQLPLKDVYDMLAREIAAADL